MNSAVPHSVVLSSFSQRKEGKKEGAAEVMFERVTEIITDRNLSNVAELFDANFLMKFF